MRLRDSLAKGSERQSERDNVDRPAGQELRDVGIGLDQRRELRPFLSHEVRTDELLEPFESHPPAQQVYCVTGSTRAAIGELLTVNRRRESELQQQSTHIVGQSLGRSGVEDGPRPSVDAAVTLKELGDKDRDGAKIPRSDKGGYALVESPFPLQATVSKEEPHSFRWLPAVMPDRPD
jgi:hypothetical protein